MMTCGMDHYSDYGRRQTEAGATKLV